MALRQGPRTAAYICDSCLYAIRTRPKLQLPKLSASTRLRSFPSAASTTTSRCTSARRSSPRPTPLQYKLQSYNSSTYGRTYSNATSLPSEVAEQGVAILPNRRLITLSGPDAPKFLQGLITNNVDANTTDPFYATFLDARGRVLWDTFIWPFHQKRDDTGANIEYKDKWACYIEVDGSEVESVLRHLKKHKLRSKISIQVVPANDASIWTTWGYPMPREFKEKFPKIFKGVIVLEDPRAPGFAHRGLVLEASPEFAWLANIEVDEEQYHLRRYIYGVAEGQKEIPRENALPMEANIDLSSGIDFRKGCYVGQELTIRTKHTGVVRKRILPVQLYREGDAVPADDAVPQFDPSWKGEVLEGADIKQLDEDGSIKKGRAAGKFIAGIGNVGLALCRLEMMTPMRVSAEGGSYKPGLEFGLQVAGEEQTEKPMRIKAFVPKWLREREKELWDKGRQKNMQ